MDYKWTDTQTIQSYLDAVGKIRIGGNDEISENSAQLYENEAVFEITTILSIGWDGINTLAAADVSDDLKRLAAKLTASRLGVARAGGTQGKLPEWIHEFRRDVYQQARFMVINKETTEIKGATPRDIPISKILIHVKQRDEVRRVESS